MSKIKQGRVMRDYLRGVKMADLRKKHGCSRFAIKRALIACGGRR